MSVNRVCITGHLGDNAELRQTNSGNSVLNFRMAVNERRKNAQTGQYDDYANWVTCVLFGQRAQAIAQYMLKGSKVAVEGRLHYSAWQDQQTGQNRSKLEVWVDEIDFMSQGQGQPNRSYGQNQPQGNPQPQQRRTVPQNVPQAAPQPQPDPQYGGYNQGYYSQPPQQQGYQGSVYDEDIPF